MVVDFVITFRETLEAALIISIILGFLVKTKQTKYNKFVWGGVGAGLVASIIGAILFVKIAGGFTGRAEELFEGILMLVGAFLLTTVILWMIQQRERLKKKIETKLESAKSWELFFLSFIAILREGIETIIFLGAASYVAESSLLTSLAGVVVAVIIGYLVFKGSLQIRLKPFFTGTSILLILFAAGLTAQGVHELQEGDVIPTLNEELWDINPPKESAFHEDGAIGSFFKGLFGYNGDPSLLEVLSYLAYIGLVLLLWNRIKKK